MPHCKKMASMMTISEASLRKARFGWPRTRNVTIVLSVMAISAASQEIAGSATPLNDLGTGLYLNQFQGGLYPNGSNDAPTAHEAEGVSRAFAV